MVTSAGKTLLVTGGKSSYNLIKEMDGMKSKLLYGEREQRIFAIVFDKGDELISGLKDFAGQNQLRGSYFTAIGAFSQATLGYFQRDALEYKKIPVNEQVEVLSLVGNIIKKEDGSIQVHAHGVMGKENGDAIGGHILEARIWPTLEVILNEEPAYLRRSIDFTTGLALIDLNG